MKHWLFSTSLVAMVFVVGWPISLAVPATENFGEATPLADENSDELRNVQRTYNASIRPLLKQYCGDCHWGAESEAGFDLEGYETLDQLLNGRKKWKKALVRVSASEMPPTDAEPIPAAEHAALLQWIDHLLNSVDCTNINPGTVTIRRLNRTEYKNTITDLVGIDYQPADRFPGDDVGYGFDNIADVLSLPPILLEKYLEAAEEITSQAIVDPSIPAFQASITGAEFRPTGGSSARNSQHLMTTDGTIDYPIRIPDTGTYEIVVRAFGDQAGGEEVKMNVAIDEKSLGNKRVRAESDKPADFKFSARLKAGEQSIRVSFKNDYYDPDKGDRNLYLVHVTIAGPRGKIPEPQKQLIPESPTEPAAQLEAARRAINHFASRAYRRRVTGPELDRLQVLYQQARDDGECYELSLRFAFQAVLVSPYFLYKIEAPTPAGETRVLGDFELATNLSYFFWSTMPDEELLRLASHGQLRDPDIYRAQVVRMLGDPRAEALVENFVAQWLQLRHLEIIKPDPDLFPGVDEALLRDMAIETKMMIADLIKRDTSLMEIMDNQSTFLNERLAKHYGIAGIEGDAFREVATEKSGRMGLMTQASILTLTSNPTRTSPVKRGKWIMENLLGEQPPPPDPAAMQLEDQAELTGSLRQRMEQHRADPNCAVCHQVMDELGFALEHYDAVGQWRDLDETNAIDDSGELPDGTRFQGARELQATVKTKMQDQFVRCLTEKLLIYALGRGLEYYDECSVDKIIEQIEPGGYRFSDLLMAIATSDPFVRRQGPPLDEDEE